MRLELTVPERLGAPDDPDVLAVVEATAAQRAAAWTEPIYLGTQDGQHRYAVDAAPRASSIVTTADIAPDLLPPHVL